jgi:hypothetical protein
MTPSHQAGREAWAASALQAAAAVVELLITFTLCYVMLNVAISKDQPGNGFAPAVYGPGVWWRVAGIWMSRVVPGRITSSRYGLTALPSYIPSSPAMTRSLAKHPCPFVP